MFCNQCGKEIPNEALFCPGCGAKREVMPEAAPVEPVVPVQETPVMAQPAAPEQPAASEQPAQAQPVAPAVPPAAPAKKSGGFPFKIMIPVAIVFVLLAVILVAVLLMGKGSKYDTYAEKELMYSYEDDCFYVFGDEDTTFEIEEDDILIDTTIDDLQINGKGKAYARFLLVDNNHTKTQIIQHDSLGKTL